MSGHIGDLSPKQAEHLERFREKVADILSAEQLSDDYWLLQWLRARDFDVKKSEKMIRNNVVWRKDWNIDRILDDYTPNELVMKYYTGGMVGFDKEGSPIWIDPHGRIDMKGISYSAKKRDILKSNIYRVEQNMRTMEEQSKKLNKRVGQMCLIFDLEKLSWRHMWKPGVDLFNELVQMVEDNYPETLKVNYVINAPKYFPIAFNLVKPFLTEATIKKIRVYGTHGWKEALLKDIEADQLPAHYGGTMTDPDGDPRCRSKICYGGRVPEEHYIAGSNNDRFDTVNELIREICVGRGQYSYVHFTIPDVNTVIRWEFKTDSCDLGFGVYHSANSDDKESDYTEVLPLRRVNCHLVMEDGMITCKTPGVYHLKFDNSYSWLRGKKVMYIIEIIKPSQILDKSPSNHGLSLTNQEIGSA